MARLLARLGLGACAAALAAGCDLESPADKGAAVFRSATAGGADGKRAPYTCAFCHDVEAAPEDGFVRPGYGLRNAARRPSFWGGTRRTLRDAANLCVTSFMRAPDPGFLPDDPEWKALATYIESLSDPGGAAAAMPMSLPVDCNICPKKGCDACAPAEAGDPAAGGVVYRKTCSFCHGSFGSAGTPPVSYAPCLGRGAGGRLKLCGTEDGDSDNNKGHASAKIRFGNFGLFGVPAPGDKSIELPPGTIAHLSRTPNMPPYSHERLPEQELVDLLTYMFPGSP